MHDYINSHPLQVIIRILFISSLSQFLAEVHHEKSLCPIIHDRKIFIELKVGINQILLYNSHPNAPITSHKSPRSSASRCPSPPSLLERLAAAALPLPVALVLITLFIVDIET